MKQSMRLSEIAEKIGIPVDQIMAKHIKEARKKGMINCQQEKELIEEKGQADITKADSIWKMSVGIRRADCLWQD
jgi:predicted transcriptional regulator